MLLVRLNRELPAYWSGVLYSCELDAQQFDSVWRANEAAHVVNAPDLPGHSISTRRYLTARILIFSMTLILFFARPMKS